ncbi:MAG: hypothetical protein GIW99_07295 [Candidatus Eremiobacteraeota bacterium]|nr:hypothetical protein [Candidatus Eremiobacteraeota bacterium]MBC5827468.1 hypothetical protein [Candidatus Eremiobacteraeota bacterium]
MNWEALTALATLGTFFVVALSAFAAVKQLRHLQAGNQSAQALAMMERWSSQEYRSIMRYINTELDGKMQDPDFRAGLEEARVDNQTHPELMVCGYWEQIGSLVKLGAMTEAACMDMASYQVLSMWNKLSPTIAIMRRKRGPSLFDNFEYLAARAQLWEESHADTYPKDTPRMPIVDIWAPDNT